MAMVIWMIKILVFSIENIFKDEHLVQINLDTLIISKLIYKNFYYCLIYIRPDRMLKIAKDVGILINKVKILEYHYKFYMLSKSIYIIFYTPLALTVCYFIEIY